MKRITENYDAAEYHKADLRAEVDARGLDVPASATTPDLISALKADDKAKGKAKDNQPEPHKVGGAKAKDEHVNTSAAGDPVTQNPDPAAPFTTNPPHLPENTKVLGTFKRKSDGENYEIKTRHDSAMFPRTHFGKSAGHVWEGTGTQFVNDFTGTDGKEFSKEKKVELAKPLT